MTLYKFNFSFSLIINFLKKISELKSTERNRDCRYFKIGILLFAVLLFD